MQRQRSERSFLGLTASAVISRRVKCFNTGRGQSKSKVRPNYRGECVAGPILAVRECLPKRARIIGQDWARRFFASSMILFAIACLTWSSQSPVRRAMQTCANATPMNFKPKCSLAACGRRLSGKSFSHGAVAAIPLKFAEQR